MKEGVKNLFLSIPLKWQHTKTLKTSIKYLALPGTETQILQDKARDNKMNPTPYILIMSTEASVAYVRKHFVRAYFSQREGNNFCFNDAKKTSYESRT
jgi:hypothetical protein